MKNFIYSMVGIAACLLMGSAAPSLAQEGLEPGASEQEQMQDLRFERGGKDIGNKMWQEAEASLGLTDAQRSRMKELRESSRASQEKLRAQLKEKREALRKELDAQNPDRAKAEAVVKEIGVLQQQMAMDRVAQVFAVRAVLTPEQSQKLRAFHEKKRSEFKARRGESKGKRGAWKREKAGE